MTELTVYHGTSHERWSSDGSGGDGLYVTTNPAVAAGYAKEWEDEDQSPLLVSLNLLDIQGMPGVTLLPNFETVQQYADGAWGPIPGKSAQDLNWEDTLAQNGTFVLGGFAEQHKQFAKVLAP